MWSEREEERTEVTNKKKRRLKININKCTKKRNDLWKHIKLRVCRSEPFIKDNFIS